MVRERVLRIIKGKKLVGYHLPQKMADFGMYSIDSQVVSQALKDVSNDKNKAPESPKKSDEEVVFNPISPRKEP